MILILGLDLDLLLDGLIDKYKYKNLKFKII